MNSINKFDNKNISTDTNFHKSKPILSKKVSKISEKISRIFNFSKKEIEIFHLGGTSNPTFDPKNRGKKLDAKAYFYERIPIKTKTGEIHLYGNELKKYVEEWIAEIKKGKTNVEFQQWMETKTEDLAFEKDIKVHGVRYLNDTERAQTEIHVDKKGSLCQIGLDSKETKPTTLKKGEYAFVLGELFNETKEATEMKFYATPKVKTEKGKIQHSSFLRGSNVKSTGMIVVNDKGQIINIQNRSGHYKPSQRETAYLIQHLKASGFDVSQLHITHIRHKFFHFVSSQFKINFKWGIVTQNAERWFETTGKHLIVSIQ